MRILALVTARGGSKGLPGKNIKSFKGHPLIAWTVAQARSTRAIHRVVLSTDDEAIAQAAKHYGADVPFIRPTHLASDQASSLDVALHALSKLEESGERFDILVLLQPTSPLRLEGDLDRMVQQLLDNWQTCDATLLVAPLKPSPASALVLTGDDVNRTSDFNTAARQQLPNYHASFGLGWAIKVAALKEDKTFYPQRMKATLAQRAQAVDIDDALDFSMAEAMFDFLQSQGHFKGGLHA